MSILEFYAHAFPARPWFCISNHRPASSAPKYPCKIQDEIQKENQYMLKTEKEETERKMKNIDGVRSNFRSVNDMGETG